MRVALIGTGYIAGRHAEALSHMTDVEIIGHVDVTLEGAQGAATKWGGRAYASVKELLAAGHLDAVWICVPPFAHGDVETELFTAGIPCYIEKPIAADTDIPQRLAKLIEEKKITTSVGYYWRCMEVTNQLREMLSETPPHLIRAAWHGLTPPAPWWRVEAKSGGQIVEQATHLFDIARYLVGEARVVHSSAHHFPSEKFPDMDIAQVSAATLAFNNGALGVFTATCVIHATVDAGIEFFCDGRKLTLTNKLLVIEDPQGRREVPVGRDPLVVADERFIKAVASKDPSHVVCTYQDAVRTQELCCAVRDQAEITP